MTTPMKKSPEETSTSQKVIGAIGAAAGAVVGRQAGGAVLIVGLLILLVGLPLYSFTSDRRRALAPAGAVMAGQGLWGILASMLIIAGVAQVAIDLSFLITHCLLVILGALALVFWPNIIMVGLVTVYQLASTVFNVLQLTDVKFPADQKGAILVHVLLHVLILALMYEGYFRRLPKTGKKRKKKRLKGSAPEQRDVELANAAVALDSRASEGEAAVLEGSDADQEVARQRLAPWTAVLAVVLVVGVLLSLCAHLFIPGDPKEKAVVQADAARAPAIPDAPPIAVHPHPAQPGPGGAPIARQPPVANPEPSVARIDLPALPAPVEIRPAPLQEAMSYKLPAPTERIRVGGGGRWLILKFSSLRKLGIFDSQEARIVRYLPLDDPDATFAAGMTRLVIWLPASREVQRYDLRTGQRDFVGKLDLPDGNIGEFCMGHASDGPLLVAIKDREHGIDRGAYLFDTERFQRVVIPQPGQLFNREPMRLPGGRYWAGPTGRVFGHDYADGAVTEALFFENGNFRAVRGNLRGWYLLPGPDERHFYSGGNGLVSMSLEAVPNVPATLQGRLSATPSDILYLPATHGSFYFHASPVFDFQYARTRVREPIANVPIYQLGSTEPVVTLKQVNRMRDELIRKTIGVEYSLHLIPRARLLAMVGESCDELRLYPVNLDEALAKSGRVPVHNEPIVGSKQTEPVNTTPPQLETPPSRPSMSGQLTDSRPGARSPDHSELQPLPAPVEIRPAPLKEVTSYKLPAPADGIRVGGGGRWLILKFGSLRKLGIFDCQEAKIVRYVSLSEDDAAFAAGMNRLFVYLPAAQVIQRYNLLTGERDHLGKLELADGPLEVFCMGHASEGPLLAGVKGQPVHLFETERFQRLPLPKELHYYHGKEVGIEPGYYWAGGTGRVFGHTGNRGMPNGVKTLVFENGKFRKYSEHQGAWYVLPGPDDRYVYAGGHGVTSSQVRPVPNVPATILRDAASGHAFNLYLPAHHGPFYLHALTADDPRRDRNAQAPPLGRIQIYRLGDKEPFLTLDKTDVCRSPWQGLKGVGIEYSVHLVPRAKLLAVLPDTRDALRLYPVDLEAALEKSGRSYLLVTSLAPGQFQRGKPFTYQLEALASKRPLTWKLESAPAGMTITTAGVVTWQVPTDFAESRIDVIISVRDGDGQEALHTFTSEAANPER